MGAVGGVGGESGGGGVRVVGVGGGGIGGGAGGGVLILFHSSIQNPQEPRSVIPDRSRMCVTLLMELTFTEGGDLQVVLEVREEEQKKGRVPGKPEQHPYGSSP